MGDPLPQFRFGTENIRQSLRTIACLGEVLCVLCLLSGCRSSAPKVGLIYNRAAQYENGDRNPIIVIPGITGSTLTLGDHIVWGAFEGGHSNSETAEGARALALPMRRGVSLAQLRDDTQAAGVLDHLEISVLGLSIRLRAYVGLLNALGIGGFRDANLGLSGAMDYGDSHFTCFQFGYDWRRDNVENARRLHQFILEKKKYIRMERTKRFGRDADEEIKFDIVAHSMGGLVARYYLRYGPNEPPPLNATIKIPWSGCENVERLILVGTPNAGSAEAVTTLVNGASFAPLLPKWAPAIVGTFPSVYQMLPRSRHRPLVDKAHPEWNLGDILDPKFWDSHEWGLAAPNQDGVLRRLLPDVAGAAQRHAIALDHQRKCLARARLFFHAMDAPGSPPPGTELFLFAGDAVDTPNRLSVDSADGDLAVHQTAPGDGIVARNSVLMDERMDGNWSPLLRSPIRWKQVFFLFKDHRGLVTDPFFIDNVLYLLLEDPRDVN